MSKEIAGTLQPASALGYFKCFTLFCEGEMFGLSVQHAQTIFRVTSVTRIPLGPPEILGLINLRGKIVTAISLRERLQMPQVKSVANCYAIEIEQNGESFGLVVDQVGDVIELHSSMRIPTPPHFDQKRSRLTSALYRTESALIPILDLDKILEFAKQEWR